MEVFSSGSGVSFDSSEIADVDFERLLLERRDREERRTRIAALRVELSQVDARIAKAQGAGDSPYSTDAGHPLNIPGPGEVPWGRPITTGNDILPALMGQRDDILMALEAEGEAVE